MEDNLNRKPTNQENDSPMLTPFKIDQQETTQSDSGVATWLDITFTPYNILT